MHFMGYASSMIGDASKTLMYKNFKSKAHMKQLTEELVMVVFFTLYVLTTPSDWTVKPLMVVGQKSNHSFLIISHYRLPSHPLFPQLYNLPPPPPFFIVIIFHHLFSTCTTMQYSSLDLKSHDHH